MRGSAALLVILAWFTAWLTTCLNAAELPVLTLEDAWKEAKAHSPDLRQAQDAAEQQDWKRSEALSGFLPTLSGTGYHYFNQKVQTFDISVAGTAANVPLIAPFTQFSFDVNLPLFDGLQNVYHYKSTSEASQAAVLNRSWTAFRLERQIRVSYYQAVAANLIEGVAEENVKTLEEHLRTTRSLKRQGQGTRYDELRVQVQLQQAMTDRVQAQNSVIVTRKKLAQLIGLENDERPIQLDLPAPDPGLVRYADLKPETVDRSDIQALERLSESADLERTAEGVYWVPKFSFGAEYQWYNDIDSSIAQSSEFRNAYFVGLFLKWNIFDGAASYSRSKQSIYEKQQAQDREESSRLQAFYDIEQAKKDLTYAIALYQSQTEQVTESQEAVRLAHDGYRVGTRTINDVLDAQLDLYRARAGVVNSKLSSIQSLTNLELALGRAL